MVFSVGIHRRACDIGRDSNFGQKQQERSEDWLAREQSGHVQRAGLHPSRQRLRTIHPSPARSFYLYDTGNTDTHLAQTISRCVEWDLT